MDSPKAKKRGIIWALAALAAAALGCSGGTSVPPIGQDQEQLFGPKQTWNAGEVLSIRSLPISTTNSSDRRFVGFPLRLEVTLKPTASNVHTDLTVGLISGAAREIEGRIADFPEANAGTYKKQLDQRAICILDQKLRVSYNHDVDSLFDSTIKVVGDFIIPETCLSNHGTAGTWFTPHELLANAFQEGLFRVFLGQDVKVHDYLKNVKSLETHHIAMMQLMMHDRVRTFDPTREHGDCGPELEQHAGSEGCFPRIHVARTAPSGDVWMKNLAVSSRQSNLQIGTCEGQFGAPLWSMAGSLEVFGARKTEQGPDGGVPLPVNAVQELFEQQGSYAGEHTEGKPEIRVHYSLCPSSMKLDPTDDQVFAGESISHNAECAAGTAYTPLNIHPNGDMEASELPKPTEGNVQAFEDAVQALLRQEPTRTEAPALYTTISKATVGAPVDFSEDVVIHRDSEACYRIMNDWTRHDRYNVRACAVAPFKEHPDVDSANCRYTQIRLTRSDFPKEEAPLVIAMPTQLELSGERTHQKQILGGAKFSMSSFFRDQTNINGTDGAKANMTFGLRAGGHWVTSHRRVAKRSDVARFEVGGTASMRLHNGASKVAKVRFFNVSFFELDPNVGGSTTLFNLPVSSPFPLVDFPFFGIDLDIDLKLVGVIGLDAVVDAQVSNDYDLGGDTLSGDDSHTGAMAAFGPEVLGHSRRFKRPLNPDVAHSGRLQYIVSPRIELRAVAGIHVGLGVENMHLLQVGAEGIIDLVRLTAPWAHQLRWELVHPFDPEAGGANDNVAVMRAVHTSALRHEVDSGDGAIDLVVKTGVGIGCMGKLASTRHRVDCWINHDLFRKPLLSWPGKHFSKRLWLRGESSLLVVPPPSIVKR